MLDLVVEGLSYKLMADRLHLSAHTVKFHVNVILLKLGVATKLDAAVLITRMEAFHSGYQAGIEAAREVPSTGVRLGGANVLL